MKKYTGNIACTCKTFSHYFGKNIKFLRKLKKLRQDEMQAQLGIPRATWSNYELDQTEPNFLNLSKISSFFGVSIDDLITKNVERELENVALNKRTGKFAEEQNVALNVAPNVALNGLKIQNLSEFAPGKEDGFIDNYQVISGPDVGLPGGQTGELGMIKLPGWFLRGHSTVICIKIKEPSAPTEQDGGGFAVMKLINRVKGK